MSLYQSGIMKNIKVIVLVLFTGKTTVVETHSEFVPSKKVGKNTTVGKKDISAKKVLINVLMCINAFPKKKSFFKIIHSLR